MKQIFALLSGLLFGVGLLLAGMSDPAKVMNFLDVFGTFDPSLAFVMGGAAITTFIGYRLVWRRGRPLLLADFQIPSRHDIDGDLVLGGGWIARMERTAELQQASAA